MRIKNETSAGGIVFRRIPNLESKVQSPESIVWLVTQHSQHKGWVFPKGLIGDTVTDEPMETAAIREVEEEGGVKAKIMNPKPSTVTYSYLWNDMQVDKTVHYFLMEYISGDPKDHDWEMMDAKFMSEGEVKKILSYPSDKQAFEEILKMMND
jgi:8-oxo-dGTP pyrophosphatase MutT (NUDIX family)